MRDLTGVFTKWSASMVLCLTNYARIRIILGVVLGSQEHAWQIAARLGER